MEINCKCPVNQVHHANMTCVMIHIDEFRYRINVTGVVPIVSTGREHTGALPVGHATRGVARGSRDKHSGMIVNGDDVLSMLLLTTALCTGMAVFRPQRQHDGHGGGRTGRRVHGLWCGSFGLLSHVVERRRSCACTWVTAWIYRPPLQLGSLVEKALP